MGFTMKVSSFLCTMPRRTRNQQGTRNTHTKETERFIDITFACMLKCVASRARSAGCRLSYTVAMRERFLAHSTLAFSDTFDINVTALVFHGRPFREFMSIRGVELWNWLDGFGVSDCWATSNCGRRMNILLSKHDPSGWAAAGDGFPNRFVWNVFQTIRIVKSILLAWQMAVAKVNSKTILKCRKFPESPFRQEVTHHRTPFTRQIANWRVKSLTRHFIECAPAPTWHSPRSNPI